jgi:hypothetical protein
MAILVDYNQIVLANVYQVSKDLKSSDPSESKNIIRHSIITSLLSYKKKFQSDYGEMIICCDSRNYWREDIFPEYKAGRKKSREESDLPWDIIFEILNEVRESIKKYFPWRVVHVDRCESDDIRAVLTKYLTFNETSKVGLYDDPSPILIISSDGDDTQLTENDNVRQWCPKQKKYLPKLSKEDLRKFKIEHIVKGDAGDGIPNIFMPSDFFVTKESGKRQKSVTQSTLDLFYMYQRNAIGHLPKEKIVVEVNGKKKKIDESDEDYKERLQLIEERYVQNMHLVLYANIPDSIEDSIIDHFKNNKPVGKKIDVYNYLNLHRCRLLLNDIDDF